jgi:hypothetical protein
LSFTLSLAARHPGIAKERHERAEQARRAPLAQKLEARLAARGVLVERVRLGIGQTASVAREQQGDVVAVYPSDKVPRADESGSLLLERLARFPRVDKCDVLC